jgi:hypothetical protein
MEYPVYQADRLNDLVPPWLANPPFLNNNYSIKLECERNTLLPGHQRRSYAILVHYLEKLHQACVRTIENYENSLKYANKSSARRLTAWLCYACLFRAQLSESYS